MIYKYEMHIHTRPCSGGGADIRDHIDALVKKGYSGMVVTNHFFNGDTRIDKSLSWADFVDAYKRDYLYGLEYACKIGFDLLFGLEEQVGNGQELLIYGVTADFIAAHPELKTAGAEKYAEIIHSAGGLVYQAHPYRDRDYIISPFPVDCIEKLDGIEVFNACNQVEWNESAEKLAKDLNLACIGGSDAHTPQSAGHSGIMTRERIRNNSDLVRILKNGEYTVIKQY